MISIKKVIPALALVVALVLPSQAYVVDGLLNDWGVTPHSDWVPDSTTAEWVEENYWGGPDNALPGTSFGGNEFDVEAMYFEERKKMLSSAKETIKAEVLELVSGYAGYVWITLPVADFVEIEKD